MSGFLDEIYELGGDPERVRAAYDAWAESYEAEVGESGYATPPRVAGALALVMGAPLDRPVLDFGCGTGLSGLALRGAGFSVIDGMDLSEEMLARAREKAIYRQLSRVEGNAPLPFETGAYAAIAAIGVIGPGAAPIALWDTLFDKLAPGQFLAFSFNDHALEDPAHEAALERRIRAEEARLRYKDYGPHLPAHDLKSCVYVIERT